MVSDKIQLSTDIFSDFSTNFDWSSERKLLPK